MMLNRQVVTKAKGTAILAVVLIHLLAVLPAKYYFAESIGLGAWILIFGQIILRFCVPLFWPCLGMVWLKNIRVIWLIGRLLYLSAGSNSCPCTYSGQLFI